MGISQKVGSIMSDDTNTAIVKRSHEIIQADQQKSDDMTNLSYLWERANRLLWLETPRTILKSVLTETLSMSVKRLLILMMAFIALMPMIAFFISAFALVSVALFSLLFFQGTLFALIATVLVGLLLAGICITCSVMAVGALMDRGLDVITPSNIVSAVKKVWTRSRKESTVPNTPSEVSDTPDNWEGPAVQRRKISATSMGRTVSSLILKRKEGPKMSFGQPKITPQLSNGRMRKLSIH